MRQQDGQVTILAVGLLLALVLGGLLLSGVARGIGVGQDRQGAADLAALAAARAMHERFSGLFEPSAAAAVGGAPHVELADYLAAARQAAEATARANGASEVRVSFPDKDSFSPTRVRVTVLEPIHVGDQDVAHRSVAEAELAPPVDAMIGGSAGAGDYSGPLAVRQGQRMRPDVAIWFDRMAAAARGAGIALSINSAYRSNAEQAVLFARHPDPKWVARPGTSLHRLGTELDLGPPAAYGWLAANAGRFHFVQRYSWEAWHYGFTLNAGSSSVGFGKNGRAAGAGSALKPAKAASSSGGSSDGKQTGSLPSFVPSRFAPMIARSAQRWNVSGALLAAQIYAESNFNPYAVSSAGAAGIAQFMPATGQSYGLSPSQRFDPAQSIDAQAHLMRDLLRQFGSVPLALAAYNAGPGAVKPCMCIPPFRQTRNYVAKILGLLGGAGQLLPGGGLEVRLVA